MARGRVFAGETCPIGLVSARKLMTGGEGLRGREEESGRRGGREEESRGRGGREGENGGVGKRREEESGGRGRREGENGGEVEGRKKVG